MLPLTGSHGERDKVVLVNPNQMKPPVAPIALDYLAHALEENKYDVDILDLCFSTDFYRDIQEYFIRNYVVAVGFSIRNTDDAYFVSQDFFLPAYRDIINLIKMQTSAPIILGGAGFSTMPEAILNFFDVDLGIWGEGEIALPAVIDRILANKDYKNISGLVYRSQGNTYINRPKFYDLSRITTPTREYVDNKRYFIEGGMGSIETKRGCPKKCIYCGDPASKGNKQRLRSPQSVVTEIKALLEMGIDHLHFCDSEFNIPEDHAHQICTELISQGLGDKVKWYTYASPGGFSQELAALCRKAGCAGIDFGVDSGCDRILGRLGRDFKVKDLVRTAEACRQEGIVFMYDLLLGGPGESRQSIKETIETMKRISPDRVGISLGIRITPETKLAEFIRKQEPLSENINLQGEVIGNDSFIAPIFYLSSLLGDNAPSFVSELIDNDERFFFVSPDEVDQNYNYNDNSLLANAIKEGYRGAFWDILRRLSEKN